MVHVFQIFIYRVWFKSFIFCTLQYGLSLIHIFHYHVWLNSSSDISFFTYGSCLIHILSGMVQALLILFINHYGSSLSHIFHLSRVVQSLFIIFKSYSYFIILGDGSNLIHILIHHV